MLRRDVVDDDFKWILIKIGADTGVHHITRVIYAFQAELSEQRINFVRCFRITITATCSAF